MLSTARYRHLLERVYLDMVNAKDLVGVPTGGMIVNVLEYKPFDAAFYNVGVPLPTGEPAKVAGRWPNQQPLPAPFDEVLFPLVLKAFQRVHVQVEKVFENFTSMVSRSEWFPAILSPDLVGIVQSWREWWEKASSHPGEVRRGRSAMRERVCWLELSRLLLSLTPQPAYKGRSAGNVVYAQLTGRKSPDPNLLLDNDCFLKMQKSYTWRSGGETDSLSELRSLLELLSVVPVPPDMQGLIISKALSDPNRVLVDWAMSELAGDMAMTAIGGPMIHNGQLEGIIYAAAHRAPLEEQANQSLKRLASLGAARRHQLREHIMRDVLLRAAQTERELSPALLVLKHIPLLFSIVGATAVCLRQGDSRLRLPSAGLIWRESRGERQQMRFAPNLEERRDRVLLDEIRQYARLVAASASEKPGCRGRDDQRTERLLAAFQEEKQLVGLAQTVCAFNVKIPIRAEEWVYLLFFLEPRRGKAKGLWNDHLHLETSAPQMWLELEAALDFVLANRSAIEQTVLKLVYTSAAHSLQGPASFALGFVDLAAIHLANGSLEMAQSSLAKAQVALKTLTYSTRAAQKFIHRRATPSNLIREPAARSLVPVEGKGSTPQQIVDEYVALFRSANPRIGLKVEVQGNPIPCKGRSELLLWVIWEMLENATRATGMMAEFSEDLQQVRIAVHYGVRTVSVVVDNPAGPLTQAACRIMIENAKAGHPNPSNTSGGSGMGLAYCVLMAREMGSWFSMRVRQGRCITKLTLRSEV